MYYLKIILEDIYNLIRMANTKRGNFIIYSTYLPPNE